MKGHGAAQKEFINDIIETWPTGPRLFSNYTAVFVRHRDVFRSQTVIVAPNFLLIAARWTNCETFSQEFEAEHLFFFPFNWQLTVRSHLAHVLKDSSRNLSLSTASPGAVSWKSGAADNLSQFKTTQQNISVLRLISFFVCINGARQQTPNPPLPF